MQPKSSEKEPVSSPQITPVPTDESWNVVRLPSDAPVHYVVEEDDEDVDGIIDLTASRPLSKSLPTVEPAETATTGKSQFSAAISTHERIDPQASSVTLEGTADFSSGFNRFHRSFLHQRSVRETDFGTSRTTRSIVSSQQIHSSEQLVNPPLLCGSAHNTMLPDTRPNKHRNPDGSTYGAAVAQHPYSSRPSAISQFPQDDSNSRFPVARPATADYTGDLNRVASAAYSKAMKDAAMMAAAHSAWNRTLPPQPAYQPIIIQNTTKAVADAQTELKSDGIGNPPSSFFERCIDFLQMFWQSKINRLIIISIAGVSAYFYMEWWQHRKRMDLLQRRIDANPLLKLGHFISASAERRQPPGYF